MKSKLVGLGETFDDVLGNPIDIKVRTGAKFCKICKVKLSMYNKGVYCFVHVTKGMELESIATDKKIAKYKSKSLKACNKRYYIRKKEGLV